MNRKITILFLPLAMFLLTLSTVLGQERAAFYYFDQGDVVFEFNIEKYNQALTNKDGKTVVFDDLDIKEILVTNAENDWSEKGWSMKKVGSQTYQLRKKIKQLGQGFDWNYRFLINQKYFANPDPDCGLLVEPSDLLSDVYELEYNQIQTDRAANIVFKLDGFKDAKRVILTGSFNEWREHELQMKPRAEGWNLELNLPHGQYEYKFIVDGNWMDDPANPNKVRNEHDTYNSRLDHFQEVRFFLKGHAQAKKVHLAGTFNNWSSRKTKMTQIEDGWEYHMKLNHGKHFYKFIVDGAWMIDSANPLSEFDFEGNSNSVLFVE